MTGFLLHQDQGGFLSHTSPEQGQEEVLVLAQGCRRAAVAASPQRAIGVQRRARQVSKQWGCRNLAIWNLVNPDFARRQGEGIIHQCTVCVPSFGERLNASKQIPKCKKWLLQIVWDYLSVVDLLSLTHAGRCLGSPTPAPHTRSTKVIRNKPLHQSLLTEMIPKKWHFLLLLLTTPAAH